MQVKPSAHAKEPPDDGLFCPVLDDPLPECYCYHMRSLEIPKMIHFCKKNYRLCPVYRNFLQQKKTPETV